MQDKWSLKGNITIFIMNNIQKDKIPKKRRRVLFMIFDSQYTLTQEERISVVLRSLAELFTIILHSDWYLVNVTILELKISTVIQILYPKKL